MDISYKVHIIGEIQTVDSNSDKEYQARKSSILLVDYAISFLRTFLSYGPTFDI